MIHKDLLSETLQNTNFRKVVATNQFSQLVLMSLLPSEEIGEEVHSLDQILYIVQGSGQAILDGEPTVIGVGDVINVPKGAKHNIINGGTEAMKLITVYSPPQHPDGTVHATKADAEADEHH